MINKSNKPLVLVLTVPDASQVSSLLGVDINSFQLRESSEVTPKDFDPVPGKKYVYGLKGIQELFGVCHNTAQKYKDGIIKEAVYQSGRKIVVDADKALELFNANAGR